MANIEHLERLTLRQEKVLQALKDGARTWDELRAQTKISDEGLGFTLGELIDMRKIWTRPHGENRIYAIERRTGLVPRFGTPQRRVTDAQT